MGTSLMAAPRGHHVASSHPRYHVPVGFLCQAGECELEQDLFSPFLRRDQLLGITPHWDLHPDTSGGSPAPSTQHDHSSMASEAACFEAVVQEV